MIWHKLASNSGNYAGDQVLRSDDSIEIDRISGPDHRVIFPGRTEVQMLRAVHHR